MKKRLILLLALIMAFAFAAPANAFTNEKWTPAAKTPYALSIRLVEVEDGVLGVNFNAPATNRSYMKNEIICAIATLSVPKNTSVEASGYAYLAFSGVNVSLNVTDNFSDASTGVPKLICSANIPESNREFTTGAGGLASSNEIRFDSASLPANASSDAKYHFAFFGKLLSDKAFMNAFLTKAQAFHVPAQNSPESAFIAAMGYGADAKYLPYTEDYTVFMRSENGGVLYSVANADLDRLVFEVTTDRSGKTDRMRIALPGATPADDIVYEVVGGIKKLIFSAANDLLTGENDTTDAMRRYRALEAIYEDIVLGVFGFDYYRKGNVLQAEYFENYANKDDLLAEIAVKPLQSGGNVQTPDNPIIHPPKVGDSQNALGYTMLALMALSAAAYTLLKRKAR